MLIFQHLLFLHFPTFLIIFVLEWEKSGKVGILFIPIKFILHTLFVNLV
nr:MAG TPA: hypothetical protein [Caudoviricetes sp.]